MCGINGFNWNQKDLIEKMNNILIHRGSDDKGAYSDEVISLGQCRLSILDLSKKGHQPLGIRILGENTDLIYEDHQLNKSDIIIVFNGEIYNYKELSKEFESDNLESDGDTEIILRSYLKWGFNCVQHFNGMWAFCIYDKRKNILFCSRDRHGQKPLYYYAKNNEFVFSSEMKGILIHKNLNINNQKNINIEGLQLYFSLGFIPAPYTIFNDVYKLEKSQNIVYDLNKKLITKKWYYYELPDYNPIKNKKQLIDEGRKLLKDATKLRMRSDVPIGAFLSGGLDSTAVVSQMKDYTALEKLHTFSVGFSGNYDESHYINIAQRKFNTIHHHKYFTQKDFENIINEFSFHYDEPIGNTGHYPSLFVAKMAKEYVTVVLSGDGGDEIFGGYDTHRNGAALDMILKLPKFVRKLVVKINFHIPVQKIDILFQKFRVGCMKSLIDKNRIKSEFTTSKEYRPETYKRWTEEKFSIALQKGDQKCGEAFRIYDMLYNTLPDNYLLDRGAMASAIETRSPFLDYRFAEFSQRIPTKWKQTPFKSKILMRKIIEGLVPKEITKRGKKGFTPPLEQWILDPKYESDLKLALKRIETLNKELYEFYRNFVFNQSYKKIGYKIRLYMFENWWKKWIEN